MTWEAWLTLAVILTTVVLLVRDTVAPSLAVLGATIALMVAGVITPAEALAGFSNSAPITVAALFVVARAVEKTGALQPIVGAVLGSRGDGRAGMVRLLFPVAGASAFLNNTPIVAMFAPQVADWAERRGQPASWFLMPLSFATILGGMVTLIGTSTNLVISGLLEAAGYEPIGMFELTRVGLPIALVGIVVIVLLAPLLLPDRRMARQQFEEELREFSVHMRVSPNGPLVGRTIQEAGLRHLQGVFLVELERQGQLFAPVSPDTVLEADDRLMFVGRADMVVDLQSMRGLVSAEREHAVRLDGDHHRFFEAVVSEASPLAGKTLKETGFRSRYQAAVLAIHRAGARVNAKLGDVRLRAGDTLLLISDPDFQSRWRDRRDFLLVSSIAGTPPTSSRKALLVGAITLGIVLAAALGVMPILHAALVGAILLVLTGVLSADEARGAIDFDVIVLIAAAFGLGAAITSSGLAQTVATAMIDMFSPLGTVGVLLSVLLATILFTELITNNAAAVLVFPIAMATATTAGLDPRGVAVAVAIAASASFLTPIGYQTNTMVYGLGGYRFTDYARLGFILSIIVVLGILLLVPRFWPA
ncbi:MAG TPA: SLC13 family permease [Longimicrobiales bacterium]|nr:SLC13 family permease [Longimicrobiales bacterium]